MSDKGRQNHELAIQQQKQKVKERKNMLIITQIVIVNGEVIKITERK